ncbi:MAG: hypothetical protein M1825_004971 [Sarcosagium campestre]|nr:MAG: hypothetical protein M1825_004971 [Sarcosagium campestre]
MGHLSPYFSNPDGFGVDEYPLPAGVNVSQVHMIHRHGSRYPTLYSTVVGFGSRITNASKTNGLNASEDVSFLNDWSYDLGTETLVPRGRQELYDSGVSHYYRYGQLYDPSTRIQVRSTTQDRMTESAQNFLSGFFGLDWSRNASLLLMIESQGSNNSLAGYDNCNNSNAAVSRAGSKASATWRSTYLADATERLRRQIHGYDWTAEDTYAAQTLCPYETVAFGYSPFCSLFTTEEWQGFEYSIDLLFDGNNGFASPTGRAVGIAYVQEVLARLHNHTLSPPATTQANLSLDGSVNTFPLNQSLYFDFSHDTNIMSVLTAFGLSQFRLPQPPSTDKIPHGARNLTVSHLTPFAARLAIEVLEAPHPVHADRIGPPLQASGPPTRYIHFVLNERTIPLGASIAGCGARVDGWCEFDAFLAAQANAVHTADYSFACNGDYAPVEYGVITDGRPLQG